MLSLPALLDRLPHERTRLLDNLGRIRREIGPITPELADALADRMNIRRGEAHEVVSFYSFLQVPLDALRVCTGPVCDCAGGRELLAQAEELAPEGLPVLEVPCLGHCDLAPVGTRGDTVLPLLTRGGLEDAIAGRPPRPVSHRTRAGVSTGLETADRTLADYRGRGGYAEPPPSGRILEELRASGLVGYGGAGFPTAIKWEAVLKEPGPRFVVVNADEGEPGTIKDRYLMERRPHLVLEGMLVAMRFAEATEGFVYLREEYADARQRLQRSLDELGDEGFLDGRSIELVVGAGAYICGEETAMLESMEGRRGMPRLRPPFPAQYGYLGRPTLIDNVETLAHIPAILRLGGEAWAALGRNEAKGVRLWSISGAVREPGCYEAPNGSTLRELIEDYAGGATEEIGAIVPGGAASGILPPAAIDVPLTRESLRAWGTGPGSAAVQVFPASYPVLRLLAETMRFFAEESCQKCTPCRIGNRGLHHLFTELERGEVVLGREHVEEWLEAMALTSICGLGQGAPVPVRNAFRYWPEVFARLGPQAASA
ncbi:MAG: NADH-ubiquinone oxidoreductase-F iron-sulfur binding region domain-containing protein [Gaiellaceae bacterium]